MPTPKALAIALAARLKVITHHEPLVSEVPGLIRVSVPLSEQLSETQRLTLLLALADGDRFGHDLTLEGPAVWAEIHTSNSPHGRSE
ncbi:hypothetical protein ACF06X_23925 [Streptomyces sp. NPDC015346]|uniref:hypothetical protein n=1 Tax=Streptomyces sp. NPDC015346 TaxID=3364954 RepID=UPI003700E6C3